MLTDLNVNFEKTDCVFNVISRAMLTKEASAEILGYVTIGKELYKEFVDQRIKGSISIWAKMKKRNLKTFTTQSKVINQV